MGYYIDKTFPAEPPRKGNIVPDAKRSENFTSILLRAKSNSLWGHLPYPPVLKKTENRMVFIKTGGFLSAFQLPTPPTINFTLFSGI